MRQPSNAPKATRTTEVMNAIRARIASRALAADDRLPPDAVVASLGTLLDASLVESSVLRAPRRFRLRPEIRRLAEAEALRAASPRRCWSRGYFYADWLWH